MSSDLSDVVRRASLEAGVSLSDLQASQISIYLASLAKWNRTINLTSLKLDGFPDESIKRLIVEPLIGATRIGPVSGRWLDLGSGGGSPAIPMRVIFDRTHLTMVESRGRKAAFLRTVCAEALLDQVTVEDARIEDVDIHALLGSVSLISARALRIDRRIAEVIQELLSPSGRLVLYGRTDPTELIGFMNVETEYPDGMAVLVPRETSG